MNLNYNLSFPEIVMRHLLGMLVGVLGGFLGHYVAPIFYSIVALAPVLMITAILGWCPLYALMGINHAKQH